VERKILQAQTSAENAAPNYNKTRLQLLDRDSLSFFSFESTLFVEFGFWELNSNFGLG
jgi:hypothetical protein